MTINGKSHVKPQPTGAGDDLKTLPSLPSISLLDVVRAPVFLTQAALPHLSTDGDGRIILLSSGAGK